jgi:hypothetical protein
VFPDFKPRAFITLPHLQDSEFLDNNLDINLVIDHKISKKKNFYIELDKTAPKHDNEGDEDEESLIRDETPDGISSRGRLSEALKRKLLQYMFTRSQLNNHYL